MTFYFLLFLTKKERKRVIIIMKFLYRNIGKPPKYRNYMDVISPNQRLHKELAQAAFLRQKFKMICQSRKKPTAYSYIY